MKRSKEVVYSFVQLACTRRAVYISDPNPTCARARPATESARRRPSAFACGARCSCTESQKRRLERQGDGKPQPAAPLFTSLSSNQYPPPPHRRAAGGVVSVSPPHSDSSASWNVTACACRVAPPVVVAYAALLLLIWVLFSSENWKVFETVVFSFWFDKHYPIIE
jgi:hypothetical protein